MGQINFKKLSSTEFEVLARDVCERMLDRKLERFGEGTDEGIDLTDDVVKPTIIVQCKRYGDSNQAVQVFKKEAKKMEAFKDSLKEYYAFTSASLLPRQVEVIRNQFSEYMDSDDHVIYSEKIEDFFNERSNGDVVEKHLDLFIDLPEWYLLKDFTNKYSIRLQVEVHDGQISICDDSVQELKDYFQSYEDLKKKDLDVSLVFSDFENIAKTILRDDIVRDYGESIALEDARQKMSARIKVFRPILERAIKYMLQSSRNHVLAPYYDLHFIKKYGEKDFFYEDEFGVRSSYSDVYFWVTVANQMISDRLTERFSDSDVLNKGYCPMALWRPFRKKSCDFWTFAPDECYEVKEFKFADAYISEFNNDIQLYYIYPALYYGVAKYAIDLEDKAPLSDAETRALLNPNGYFVSSGYVPIK